jgi:hypothetical protein
MESAIQLEQSIKQEKLPILQRIITYLEQFDSYNYGRANTLA